MERYKACVEKIFLKDTLKTKANSHNLDQRCTTQISWRAKKMLLTHSRARLVKFFLFYIVLTSKIKPNVRKLGL